MKLPKPPAFVVKSIAAIESKKENPTKELQHSVIALNNAHHAALEYIASLPEDMPKTKEFKKFLVETAKAKAFTDLILRRVDTADAAEEAARAKKVKK